MNYWLIKSDPDEYPWNSMVKDKTAEWTGVRSYAARNFLRDMKVSDQALFYHSGGEKEVVGWVEVERGPIQEKGAEEGWVMVKFKVGKPLPSPVSLKQIKAEKSLAEIPLLKISRLSVMPLKKTEYDTILKLSGKGK